MKLISAKRQLSFVTNPAWPERQVAVLSGHWFRKVTNVDWYTTEDKTNSRLFIRKEDLDIAIENWKNRELKYAEGPRVYVYTYDVAHEYYKVVVSSKEGLLRQEKEETKTIIKAR